MGRTRSTPIQINNPYKFSVYRNAALNTGAGAFAVVTYDTKFFDTGSNVDIITNKGRFTAPVAGFYHFDAQFSATSTTTGQTYIISLYKNGTEISRGQRNINPTATAQIGVSVSDMLQLAAGDYIEVAAFGSAALAMEVGASVPHPTFSGFLVSAT